MKSPSSLTWCVLAPLALASVALAGCPGEQIPTGRDAAVRDVQRDNGLSPDDGVGQEDAEAPDESAPDVEVPVDSGPVEDAPAAEAGCRTNAECDDGDMCTENVCDVATGTCTYRSIAECCTDATACNDGDSCTDDTCDTATNRCRRALRAGCCSSDADCDDGNACTRDTCDTDANRCSTEAIPECCAAGETRACYTGAAATRGVGACRAGTQTCVGNRFPEECDGEVLPASSETCDTARVDEDCDGMANEECGCSNGMTRACYTGPMGTMGVGTCRGGTQTCTAGTWGMCTGQTLPATDACMTTADEDCDGMNSVCAPANDNRANAINIPVTVAESVVTGTTAGATHDGPSVECSCTSGANVWYRFTLASASAVYIDTSNPTAGLDTSVFLTNAMGVLVPAQPENGQDEAGLCNDDGGCGGVTGWGSSLQSRTWGYLEAGTYNIAVGGCGTGAFTLRLQHVPITEGSFFYRNRITGENTDTTVLVGTNRHTSTCGDGRISGEDVRWFVSCGAVAQTFSLCEGDGGGYLSRNTSTETRRWDPVLYVHSGITGHESRCSDAGATGVDCRGRIGTSLTSTTFDTLQAAPRLANVNADRGVNAVLVDERTRGSGMWYRLRYRLRDRN